MKKKEVALTINGTTEKIITVNAEYVEHGIKAFGIKLGHELGGNLVGTEKVGNIFEVREYTAYSEAALSNPTKGKLLATIKVA